MLGGPSREDEDFVADLAGKPCAALSMDEWHRLELERLLRAAMYKGSDVRLSTGVLASPASWPREGLPTENWHWRTVLAFPQSGKHINVLELQAILATLKWRLRKTSAINTRMLHASDSQVCIAVLCKGRSSSRALQSVLSRISALVVAASCYPFYVFVRSADNPADDPSRWWEG